MVDEAGEGLLMLVRRLLRPLPLFWGVEEDVSRFSERESRAAERRAETDSLAGFARPLPAKVDLHCVVEWHEACDDAARLPALLRGETSALLSILGGCMVGVRDERAIINWQRK